MKKLLLILFAFTCKAQDTLVFTKPDLFKRNYLEIGFGKPQNDLSNKYESSLNIGYWVRNKINRDQFIDLGLELNFLSKSRKINYLYQDENIEVLPNDIGLHLGARYSKIIYFSSNNHNFFAETNSGIGWSALFYKKSEEIKKKEYDFNSNINTIHLSQTIKLNYKSLGFYIQYKHTPYSLFNRNIENDFGNSTLNVGLVKGFNM
jgi:hypothetical protein